jgi:streptomycin 6-kinase
MLFDLPVEKRDAIVREFADGGKNWVENYPAMLGECVERWQLRLTGIASAGLPINVIFYAQSAQGDPLVLKMGYPHPEQKTEIIALRAYQGRDAVRILDWDDETGAFLLERILPGKKLRDVSDSIERSRIRIRLIGDLPRPVSGISGLPSYGEWMEWAFSEFREKMNPGSATEAETEFLSFIVRAESSYRRLLMRFPETYLLHGDLHHENILLDEHRGWLAIDPKGVTGPRVMECGRFLHNFIEDEIKGIELLEDATDVQVKRVLEQRLRTFEAMLDFDRTDMVAATYIDLVLGTCWSINSPVSARERVDYSRIRLLSGMLIPSD